MMMIKHTPGPWVARETGGAGWPGQIGWAIDYNEHQEQVVDFVYEEADAHLIAAAPDLLEALEGLVEYVDSMHALGVLQRPVQSSDACRAIAKAKGQQHD